MRDRPIYLDYQATTPLAPEVAEAMAPWWGLVFGNPHSVTHSFGWDARDALTTATAQAALALNADDEEIVFVSGATESCNLALRGCQNPNDPGREKLVSVATEHPAVLDTLRALEREGRPVAIVPVGSDGLVDVQELAESIDDETLVVSAMLANNEIGVVQPVREIAEVCRRAGAFLHTDATQAIGRIPVDVDELGVDLLSLSGHKIYGPMGIGILFVRERPDLEVQALLTGGGQQRGVRPGTVPVPLAVGMGQALEIAHARLDRDSEHLRCLGNLLLDTLREQVPEVRICGHEQRRIPGSLSLRVDGALADAVITRCRRELAMSTGSACSSGSGVPSHVLTALGLDRASALGVVRVSVGRPTTETDAGDAAEVLARAFLAEAGQQPGESE